MSEEILTAAQVAERLALSESRVYQLAREGEIPHFKVGRSVRFGWRSIEVWLESIERSGERVW